MELKPQIGLDNIKFGMTENQVIEAFGKPSLIIFDEDEDENPVYEYTNLKLRLTFYKDEERRLGYLRTANQEVHFKDQKLIDRNIDYALKEILRECCSDWNMETYFTFKSYFNETNWLTLNVEYNRITHIEMGVTFLDNDEDYDWPD